MSIQFPQAGQYNQAIQNPHITLSDPTLQPARIEKNQLGLPAVRSGGFVSTYHLTLPDRREKALRCYQREMPDLFSRYQMIIAAIKQPVVHDLFLNVDFQRQGILVNGQRYPVLVMDWVNGKPLNAWVESHLQQKSDLDQVAQQMETILNRLAAQHMAHGDLQHGNILVDQQGQIRLIDYDSMFVSTLKGQKPYDRGHPNFQHPQRSSLEFDETIDRFPGIVILLALKALKYEPQLWHDFGLSGENLLFTQKDFREPDQSPLLKRLERIPECSPYIPMFRAYCKGRFDSVPPVATFFKSDLPNGVAVPVSSRPIEVWETFPCFSALAPSDSLLAHTQERITIIGQIMEIRNKMSNDNRPYAQIIFSNAFAFVALVFADGLEQFKVTGRNLNDFLDKWVKMTLNLNQYQSKPEYAPRPQFTIEYPSQLGIISYSEAQQLIAKGQNLGKTATNTTQYNNDPRKFSQPDRVIDPLAGKPQQSPPQPRPKMPQPSFPNRSPDNGRVWDPENQRTHDQREKLWGTKAVPSTSNVRHQSKPQPQSPPKPTYIPQMQRPTAQPPGRSQKTSWLNRVFNQVKRLFS